MSSKPIQKSDIVETGLECLNREYREVVDCFREVLESSPTPHLAKLLDESITQSEWNEIDGASAAQVISIAFQLLDMVEERVASETRFARIETFGGAAEKGLWAHCLESLKEEGVSEDAILEAFQYIRVEPVFTAHPTEAKRPSVRERHRDIYELLCQCQAPHQTPGEKAQSRQDFVTALEALWYTGEIHVEKPTIERELRNVLYYLREVFPKTLESVDRNLKVAWESAGYDAGKLSENGKMPAIRFGLWIGGDRDGHPFVTSDVTKNTLAELRNQSIKLYRSELAEISSHLSISMMTEETPHELKIRSALLATQLEKEGTRIIERNVGEPWRAMCYLLRGELASPEKAEITSFRNDVDLLGRTLESIGAQRLKERYIEPLLQKIDTFGFHLAALDVRQNSAFHDKAASQLFSAAGIEDGENFGSWSEEKRVEFLTRELDSNRPFLHPNQAAGEEARAVLDCYQVLANHYRSYGADAGLGSLIVSMTRQLSDLLVVHLFAREAGLSVESEGSRVCPLPVVPLFETLDDLENAPGIVDRYLSHPVVQKSLPVSSRSAASDLIQQIMLGYSDSNKDGGILASQWAVHKAQQTISEVAEKHSVDIRYFHGRGGTVSRGAGPTNWFLRALPHGSLHGDFRMTEQGETIARKYAYPENANYHMESLVACVTRSTVLHSETEPKNDPGLELLPSLAEGSQNAYRALVEEDDFITFYRQVTPIDALEQTELGSRPSRRTGTATLDDLRAIPWVFSWTQSRFYIPGWYGVGTALDALHSHSSDQFAHLAEVISSSTLPRYIFTGVETNILSTDLDLMHQYGSLIESDEIRGRFLEKVENELTLTQKYLNLLFPEPIDVRRPRYAKTLALRESPLRQLHLRQIDLLREWRSEGGELPRELVFSISAIASGLRTTG